jgi:outer membrane protein assembly factor BamE (lipoprotein component of BamABCDE complex)
MKTLFNYIALIVVAVSLCLGCASTKRGSDFNSENISKLKVGITTEQEVIQLIGQPTNRTRKSDGSVILSYMYSPGQTIHAFSAITNPDLIQNAGKGRKTLTVILDADGKVKQFSETS